MATAPTNARSYCPPEFFKAEDFKHITLVPTAAAARANYLLAERGVVVRGIVDERGYDAYSSYEHGPGDTHTALLINVQPIQKDSAESLLREIVDGYDKDQYQYGTKIHERIERAKRLLGKK
jgi:hypothetical protein